MDGDDINLRGMWSLYLPLLLQIKTGRSGKNKKKNAIMMILHVSVSRTIFQRIASCESPVEIWFKLKEIFTIDEQRKKIYVRTKRTR